ncbi:MAG: hypothetical protein ACI308_07500 [Muribaculaceae bacterium]
MYTQNERVAIARIVSDMIKADNIIEESEIEMFNGFKNMYNLNENDMRESRHIKFSDAVRKLATLTNSEKLKFFSEVRAMALADGICVPKEALLLLALRYALGVSRNKCTKQYEINDDCQSRLISCPISEAALSCQYVIYVEGKHNKAVNDCISAHFAENVLRLRQWGFDFVYIPYLVNEFAKMDGKYVKDVIGYIAPELSAQNIEVVYNRLLKMDTVTFCNHVLAENLHVEEVRNASPALFVNVGTSVVPYSSSSGPVECYTEFLCLPLADDDADDVIRDFVSAYGKLVSRAEPVCPDFNSANFKYFGFYKAMFDFLVKAEPKESDIVIHPYNSRFEFPQVGISDLVLSPQEAAIYKLILDLSINHVLGGLPTSYTKYNDEINRRYAAIYRKKNVQLPANLSPVRSRIESKMRNHLAGLSNIEDFIPKLRDGKYVVGVSAQRVKISDSRYHKAI